MNSEKEDIFLRVGLPTGLSGLVIGFSGTEYRAPADRGAVLYDFVVVVLLLLLEVEVSFSAPK